ncbi:hypothetical protein NVP1190O_01, partial [Vibrio phage 1.190.O._10N.286.51.F12]
MSDKSKQKRAPRMKIDPDVLRSFLELLSKGVPQSIALDSTGWSHSSYFYKKAKDKKFKADIDRAMLVYYQTLNQSNINLIKAQHPETVKHNIQRMDRQINNHSYGQALIDAQKKAIADLDFERAERLQQEIDKA